MRIPAKKRLFLAAGAVSSVGAVATLVSGVTFGLFSAQQTSDSNVFTAGTVTEGSPVVTHCTVSHIVPGDFTSGTGATNSPCTVAVATGGTENSDVAIDVAVSGTSASSVQGYGCSAPSPASGLYDASVNGLQLALSSTDGTTPVSGYTLSGLSSASSSTTNLLTALNVPSGTTETYTLNWSMPDKGCASNNYQGATTTFTFTVHSVQAANQPTDSTTPGSADSTVSWS